MCLSLLHPSTTSVLSSSLTTPNKIMKVTLVSLTIYFFPLSLASSPLSIVNCSTHKFNLGHTCTFRQVFALLLLALSISLPAIVTASYHQHHHGHHDDHHEHHGHYHPYGFGYVRMIFFSLFFQLCLLSILN